MRAFVYAHTLSQGPTALALSCFAALPVPKEVECNAPPSSLNPAAALLRSPTVSLRENGRAL
jgi:hypothetical protein